MTIRPSLCETSLPGLPVRKGKVRDVYDLGDRLLLVATDRISAFDWILPTGIPDKGRVLTQISLFWFELLGVPNHVLSADLAGLSLPAGTSVDDLAGRTLVCRKAEVVPIECVIRGYLEGSGWKEYQESGAVCGVKLPAGLQRGSQLPEPIFTPATKEDSGHDVNISFADMVDRVGRETAEELQRRSVEVYQKSAEHARSRGIIIADTKLEWGWHQDKLILIDEVLTPDSSRFWQADDYSPGRAQLSFDKQFVRDWLEQSGWDKNSPPPQLPADIVARTRDKYIDAYERLTGKRFAWRERLCGDFRGRIAEVFARFNRVAAEKLRDRQDAFARGLDEIKRQGVLPAGDDELARRRVQNGSRFAFTRSHGHLIENQPQRLAVRSQPVRIRSGPRFEAADLVGDRFGGLGPVHAGVVFGQPRRFGHRGLVLQLAELRHAIPVREQRERFVHRINAQGRQPRFEFGGGFGWADGRATNGQTRSAVEAGCHVDDGHSGFRVALQNGPVDRRGAAILGQQRRVQVDSPQRRRGERGRRQDLAVVADDEQFGRIGPQEFDGLGRVDAVRRVNRQAAGLGDVAHRIDGLLHASARRRCGTRDECGNVVRGEERLEGRHGERAGAEHQNPHATNSTVERDQWLHFTS